MGHLYEGTRDPEGVLSTIPAIATSLFGLLTGKWLRTSHSPRTKTFALVALGAAAIVVGEIMNVWFPINKKLWTSFVRSGLPQVLPWSGWPPVTGLPMSSNGVAGGPGPFWYSGPMPSLPISFLKLLPPCSTN